MTSTTTGRKPLTLADLKRDERAIIKPWPDLGDILEASKWSVYSMIRNDELGPGVVLRIGGRIRISVPALVAWLEGRRSESAAS